MRSRVAKEARAQRRNRVFILYVVLFSVLCLILVTSYILIRLYAPRITSVVISHPSWLAQESKIQDIFNHMPNRFFLPPHITYVFDKKEFIDTVRTSYPVLDTVTTLIDGEVLTISGTTYIPTFLVCLDTCMQGDTLGNLFIDPAFSATSTLYTVHVTEGEWSKERAMQIKGHISALETATLFIGKIFVLPEEYIYEIRYTSDTFWRMRVPNTATEDYVSQAIATALSHASINELITVKKLDTLDIRLQHRLFYTSI